MKWKSALRPRGWHVPSRKRRRISCLFLCLLPSQSLIPRTSESAAVCPLELKCSATGKRGYVFGLSNHNHVLLMICCFAGVYPVIIYMKKLLDSDWLRAVQFKCNTSAKNVTPGQKVQHQCKLHIVILDYDWLKDKRKFSKTMISRKMMTKKFVQKLQMRKNGFKKDLRALSQLRIVFSEL